MIWYKDMWYTMLQIFGLYRNVATKARIKKLCDNLVDPNAAYKVSIANKNCSNVREYEERYELQERFALNTKASQFTSSNLRSLQQELNPLVEWMNCITNGHTIAIIQYDCLDENKDKVDAIIAKYIVDGKFCNTENRYQYTMKVDGWDAEWRKVAREKEYRKRDEFVKRSAILKELACRARGVEQ